MINFYIIYKMNFLRKTYFSPLETVGDFAIPLLNTFKIKKQMK